MAIAAVVSVVNVAIHADTRSCAAVSMSIIAQGLSISPFWNNFQRWARNGCEQAVLMSLRRRVAWATDGSQEWGRHTSLKVLQRTPPAPHLPTRSTSPSLPPPHQGLRTFL